MRKLVLKMSVSIDGFVGGPNGEIDWILKTMDESAASWVLTTLWQADVHIMGSRTFHDMSSYWPNSSEPFAEPMNKIPKVVFSRKKTFKPTSEKVTTQALKDATRLNSEKSLTVLSDDVSSWENAAVANGDMAEEISRLKQEKGNIILAHGGANFAQNLVGRGLVDEYRLLVHPVTLGKGLPLFSALAKPANLTLENSTVLKTGIIANIYKPKS